MWENMGAIEGDDKFIEGIVERNTAHQHAPPAGYIRVGYSKRTECEEIVLRLNSQFRLTACSTRGSGIANKLNKAKPKIKRQPDQNTELDALVSTMSDFSELFPSPQE